MFAFRSPWLCPVIAYRYGGPTTRRSFNRDLVALGLLRGSGTGLGPDAPACDASSGSRPKEDSRVINLYLQLLRGGLVGVLLVIVGLAAAQDPLQALDLMKPGPTEVPHDFTVPTPGGPSLALADLRGRVVLLNFWATWCVPCREEMPAMERLYQRFKDRGLIVLAISVDAAGSSAVVPFARKFGLTYPIGLDPKMALARQYGVRGFPASFLLDPTGAVVGRAHGSREWDSPAAHGVVTWLLTRGSG
jgi:peroxiredoxin